MQPKFEQAYEDHVDRVYGFLAYRLGSRTDAEDLTQVTFERALRAWPRFNPRRATLATWLLAIARNALIDHARRERTRPEGDVSHDDVPGGELPTAPGPEQETLGISPELAFALARLRKRDREVVALRFGADLTAAEIADLLDLSVANVQQILSRTLRRLRAHLESQARSRKRAPTGGHE
jgi:RNA polymerase sigma factor (sigma-70 family)